MKPWGDAEEAPEEDGPHEDQADDDEDFMDDGSSWSKWYG